MSQSGIAEHTSAHSRELEAPAGSDSDSCSGRDASRAAADAAAPPEPSARADFVKAFNACSDSPKRALQAVRAAGLSAPEASQLLYDAGGRVSVALLGECLGHRDAFWSELAREFPARFEGFGEMGIVEALRAYLWRLRLPGESILIERILTGFAAAFFAANPRPQPQGTSAAPWAQGHYVSQPQSQDGKRCCAHCGSIGDAGRGDPILEELRTCKGCDLVTFCRACSKLASKRGHAVVGCYGYGRACIAARELAGMSTETVTYRSYDLTPRHSGVQQISIGVEHEQRVRDGYRHWPAVSPFLSVDAVFVLCYSIIMLATNLHNVNIKAKDRMQKHQFLRQNRDVNDGENFPGDYLSAIFDDIQAKELRVLGMGVF